jgi:hypothetical protein
MPKGGWRTRAGRPTQRYKVTDCRHIDVRHFRQVGALRSHYVEPWHWRDAKTLEVNFKVNMWSWCDQVWLKYMWQGKQVEETVQIERTDCFFGGSRPWFLCPGCQGRVAILYLHKGTFRCRQCHDLRYVCQSEDAIDRTWRAQAKIERKLGNHGSRPKGMHKTSHERLADKVNQVERERRAVMHVALRRHLGLDE